ncbi:MAG: Nucleotidyl transferase AbiEii toxin, Type IV TAsystem [Candidatus Argoarchaeum ethanivorans]|uniref:Nucleotidyl transferase AbiEii toxin, Type IV TAsystem n=1 Tax=Candidatus Argoarchaeum ethanivorans TaxID=2608793 RepID=A0A811T9P4_9EURY|nr:MAG: Nucleotidyl transferase AbiEii toxin, Type IV TAsystem [Candidatus Argoarchaeum ethanivorans]
MADIEILRYLAARTGLGLNYLSKDEKISIILEQLRDLFPEVVLKGGTALSRVYLSKKKVSRFSEDVDLDFISDMSLDAKITVIKEKVREITGFDIEGPRILHRTLRFDCYYVNEFEQRDRVILEFYLTQTEAIKTEEVLVKSPFIETHPTIFKVYSIEDLMARKFIALYNRMEGKDIYDLFYCLDLNFDRRNLLNALKIMLEFYKINQVSFLNELLLRLKEARGNAYYIGNSTNHFIPRNLRPNWTVFIDTLNLKIERTLWNI